MNALKAEGLPTENVKSSIPASGDASAEVYAAIAMAIYMYGYDHGIHDVESNVLTIDTVARNYSPWSSKIYTLRQTPTVNKK